VSECSSRLQIIGIVADAKDDGLSRKSCYFLGSSEAELSRILRVPSPHLEGSPDTTRRPSFKIQVRHFIRITHRNDVEAPVTDWLRQAYDSSNTLLSNRRIEIEIQGEKERARPKTRKPNGQRDASIKGWTGPKLDRGKQLARIRRICMSIPGTSEKISHGEPTFSPPTESLRCVRITTTDGRMAVWLPGAPGVQAALIEEAPEIYFRPSYVGVSGWSVSRFQASMTSNQVR
jgi:hypothetical protein